LISQKSLSSGKKKPGKDINLSLDDLSRKKGVLDLVGNESRAGERKVNVGGSGQA